MNPNESNQSSTIYPLDDLLFIFGFTPINIYIYEIVIPIIAFIGFILCTLSLWIFFKKKFSASIYWYFRVLTLANSIHLAMAMPYGICFTPKYFPNMDTYSCVIVQWVYIPLVAFTSHLVSILEIAILLERIKIMNPFVKKNFSISPKKMILITFFSCATLIPIYALTYVPYDGGDYFYFDSNGIKRVNSFWFMSSSTLVQSKYGSILVIAVLFIKDILTLITTIILNTVSLFELKIFFKKKSLLTGRQNAIGPIPVQANGDSIRNSDVQNENKNSVKKNHIKLMLFMCLISIVERNIVVLSTVYYLFSTDYIAVILGSFLDLVFVVGPSISFFVFYHFNRDFKIEFFKVLNIFLSKMKINSTTTESLNVN